MHFCLGIASHATVIDKGEIVYCDTIEALKANDEVKTRYKQLAKQHHPDANNGDRDAEERLKTINQAYAALRGRLGAQTMAAAGC